MKIIDLHFNLDFVLFKPVFSQNKKKSNFLNFIEADSKAWCYFLVGQTVIRRYVVHICFIIDLEFVQKLLIKIIYVIKGDNFSIDLSFIDLFADSFISVFPLAERMIEVFENEGYADLTTYDSIGSGGGFERFCEAGESDISGASRAIKDGEFESCAAIGRTPIEFQVDQRAENVTPVPGTSGHVTVPSP